MPIAAAQPQPAQQDQDSKQDVVMMLENGSNEEDDDIEIEVDVGSPRHYQPRSPALEKSRVGEKPLFVLVPDTPLLHICTTLPCCIFLPAPLSSAEEEEPCWCDAICCLGAVLGS